MKPKQSFYIEFINCSPTVILKLKHKTNCSKSALTCVCFPAVDRNSPFCLLKSLSRPDSDIFYFQPTKSLKAKKAKHNQANVESVSIKEYFSLLTSTEERSHSSEIHSGRLEQHFSQLNTAVCSGQELDLLKNTPDSRVKHAFIHHTHH